MPDCLASYLICLLLKYCFIFIYFTLYLLRYCVACVCVFKRGHTSGDHRSSRVSFSIVFHLIFWDRFSWWAWPHRSHRPASPSHHLVLSSQCWDYGLEPPCPVLLHGYWGSEHGSSCLQSTSPTKPFPQPLYQFLKEQEMFSPLGKLFHDQLNYDIIRFIFT